MLTIPFGLSKETGRYVDAGSVRSGRACGCICHECKSDLQAVHSTKHQKHFRHDTAGNCDGSLESLFHKVAKEILKNNTYIKLSDNDGFEYHSCDVEMSRYDKRPDAWLSNSDENLIVEIFFSHKTDSSALNIYFENNERVLEIDISSQRNSVYEYEQLKELVLFTASRKLYHRKISEPIPNENHNGKIILGTLIISVLGWLIFRERKSRRRNFF